jgi:hypothetical protein
VDDLLEIAGGAYLFPELRRRAMVIRDPTFQKWESRKRSVCWKLGDRAKMQKVRLMEFDFTLGVVVRNRRLDVFLSDCLMLDDVSSNATDCRGIRRFKTAIRPIERDPPTPSHGTRKKFLLR